MDSSPTIRHRKSIRLKGYDYSESGSYFVTLCTKKGLSLFGEVMNEETKFSPLGIIADEEWKKISTHYLNVRLDEYSIMPNHIHGIIEIVEQVMDGASPVPTKVDRDRDNACVVPKQPIPRICSSLSSIVGSYKSGVTKRIHEAGHFIGRTIWQSRFYDHIIRDDVSFYFIQQYIELNPLMWEYSRSNPRGKRISLLEFEKMLETKFNIKGQAIGIIMGSNKMFDLNITDEDIRWS